MTDIFESPKDMLRWGKKRTLDLNAEIESFATDKPWSYVVERDNETGQYAHKLIFNDRITQNFANILFDAANNLRSVLDQIAFAVAVKHTGNPAPKSAKFPFGPTERDMRNNAAGGCKDLPPEIRDFFIAFKPYKGGNDTLWAFDELVNAPKHKRLKPFWVGAYIGMGGVTALKKWHRERHDIVFVTTDQDCRFDTNIALTVAFDEVDETLRGKRPVGALDAMATEVERVLVGTEAECRRIGLIQ